MINVVTVASKRKLPNLGIIISYKLVLSFPAKVSRMSDRKQENLVVG